MIIIINKGVATDWPVVVQTVIVTKCLSLQLSPARASVFPLR